VVHAAARHRGRDLRERQLPRGRVWPPILQHFFETSAGARPTWRRDFCVVTMVPLALALRRRRRASRAPGAQSATASDRPLGLSPLALQNLLWIAGLACCVAMSMPQVHIVAYCGDLGYGARAARRCFR
jgi:hypothetical protein